MLLSTVNLPLWNEGNGVNAYDAVMIILYVLLGLAALSALVFGVLYATGRRSMATADAVAMTESKNPLFFTLMKTFCVLTLGLLLALSLMLVENWGDAIRWKDDAGIKHWPWFWHFTKYAVIVLGLVGILTLFGLLRTNERTRVTMELTFGAVCVAISYALSYVSLFRMPMGGTITAASVLPLALYCFYFGWKKGLLATFCYSILQMFQNPVIYAVGQVILDYILPYTAVAMVGIFSAKNKKMGKWGVFVGLLMYSVVRYFCHFLSGALYFGIWVDPSVWSSVWIYSLAYNSTVFIDTLIAAAVGLVLMATPNFPREMSRYVAKAEALSIRFARNACSKTETEASVEDVTQSETILKK